MHHALFTDLFKKELGKILLSRRKVGYRTHDRLVVPTELLLTIVRFSPKLDNGVRHNLSGYLDNL